MQLTCIQLEIIRMLSFAPNCIRLIHSNIDNELFILGCFIKNYYLKDLLQ